MPGDELDIVNGTEVAGEQEDERYNTQNAAMSKEMTGPDKDSTYGALVPSYAQGCGLS